MTTEPGHNSCNEVTDSAQAQLFFDALIKVKEIIMKTIQITLIDNLHQRAQALALRDQFPLKSFVLEAIEAHVIRMEALTTKPLATKKGGSR